MSIEPAAAAPSRPWAIDRHVLRRFIRPPSLTLRAVLASRLLVLLAGAGGVLVIPRRGGFNPPVVRLGAIGNVLAGSAVRWDAMYYLGIAGHGYTRGSAEPAFFPLYPMLIHALAYLTGSGVIAGMAISLASFGCALVLLHRLTELELGRKAADAAVLLLAFAPLSFFFTAVYTESLFLVLSLATMLAARKERWALAAILGALATLTRVTGILLVVPVLIMHLPSRRAAGRHLAWFLLLPASLAAYLGFLAANGFSWLAPFTDEATDWGRRTTGPIGAIVAASLTALRSVGRIAAGAQPIYDPTRFGPFSPAAESLVLLFVLGAATAFLVRCFRRLPLEYGAYAAVALVMCISSPVSGQPLVSLDRYVLTIFPLWMVAGAWVAKRGLERPAVVGGAVLLVFYTVQFASWAFVA